METDAEETFSDGGRALGRLVTARVEFLLLQRGEGVAWLAGRLGQGEVSTRARLARGGWSLEFLDRVAEILEVPVAELFTPLVTRADAIVHLPLVQPTQRKYLVRMAAGDPTGVGWLPYQVAVRQVLTVGCAPRQCAVLEYAPGDEPIGRLQAGDHILLLPARRTDRLSVDSAGPMAWSDGALFRVGYPAFLSDSAPAWRMTRLLTGAVLPPPRLN